MKVMLSTLINILLSTLTNIFFLISVGGSITNLYNQNSLLLFIFFVFLFQSLIYIKAVSCYFLISLYLNICYFFDYPILVYNHPEAGELNYNLFSSFIFIMRNLIELYPRNRLITIVFPQLLLLSYFLISTWLTTFFVNSKFSKQYWNVIIFTLNFN